MITWIWNVSETISTITPLQALIILFGLYSSQVLLDSRDLLNEFFDLIQVNLQSQAIKKAGPKHFNDFFLLQVVKVE